MTPDDYAKVLLAVVIHREARGDGPVAEQAVASVILNRVKHEQLGSFAEKVVKTIVTVNQFSSVSVRGDSQTVVWPLATDPCFSIAEGCYSGSLGDNTNGAQFYANEATLTSHWYITNIVNSPDHPVVAVIGKQTFRK